MWDQTYGYAKQYKCSIAYYLMYFYQNNIKFFLIEPLIHEVMEQIYWMALLLPINNT